MSHHDERQLELLANWLTERRAEIDIPRQVNVREAKSAYGALTQVTIDHLLACPLGAYEGWRITTKRTFLPRGHFESRPVFKLKEADHRRGRAIYCQDRGLDNEVVAAITYHVDDRSQWPIFITSIAFRVDVSRSPELRRRTLGGAFVLKQYVHAISERIERGADLHIELPPGEAAHFAELLGFRRARKLKGFRPSGTHMRQPPLGSEGGTGG